MSGEDRQFFVEYIDDVVQRLSEIIGPLKEDMNTIKREMERLDEIETEFFAIKAVLKETNRDIRGIEHKVGNVEDKLEGVHRQLGNTHAMAYDALQATKLHDQILSTQEAFKFSRSS